ncbi:acyl-CoA N-acyltransferase [Pluteus cervinus]|uniref:Acyl-CoA N-acyltransferase n=1 Tax=Pluteus cervinus TaxID=181527 RepID=A0ACD3B678_9AGAR|nr:acyl-CoA N-acyltransferase [Pluteus cervinus]
MHTWSLEKIALPNQSCSRAELSDKIPYGHDLYYRFPAHIITPIRAPLENVPQHPCAQYPIAHFSQMFTTERTLLRGYTERDLPIILEFMNNPLVQGTLLSDPVVPRGSRFALEIEKVANEAALYLVIVATDTNQVIGAASLTLAGSAKNRDFSFGIGLVPTVWNKGYGTEVTKFIVDYAFRNIGAHRVSLNVHEGNDGAIAVYKKLGFVEEGRKRKLNWYGGKWLDSIFMGILYEEWSNKEATPVEKV